LSPEQGEDQEYDQTEQEILEHVESESPYKSEPTDSLLDTSASGDKKLVNFDKKLNVINLGFDESTLAPERGDDEGQFVISSVKKGERKIIDGTEPVKSNNKNKPKLKKLPRSLSLSDQWNFSQNLDLEQKDGNSHLFDNFGPDPLCKKRPLTGSIVRKAESDVIQERAQSAVPARILNREQEMAKKMIVGPIRTAPSIPSPFGALGSRSPRTFRAYQPELEAHARKLNSPKRYMQSGEYQPV
jgi:hypothetical protein